MKHLIIGSFILCCAFLSCNPEDKETPAPKIHFQNDGNYEISLNDTIELSPKIVYDDNSSYLWELNGDVVSTELEYQFVAPAMSDYVLTFSVVNDNGNDKHDINISCIKNITFDTFDNYVIPKKTAFVLLPDTLQTEGFMVDGIKFSNSINQDTTIWGGFAFSNRTSIESLTTTKAIGCAYVLDATTSNYMSISGYGKAIVDFKRAYTVKSIDIANDNFAYLVSKFGYISPDTSVVISHSQQEDEFILRIYGLNAQGDDVSQVDYNLVDCQFDNPAKYIRLSSWKTLPLKDLGLIYGLRFEMISTQANFPPFACIDNIKLQD